MIQYTNIQSTHYSHPGQRDYQEDRYYIGTQYWIVCDGVGGLAKGDKAAEIAVQSIAEVLDQTTDHPDTMDTWLAHLVEQTIERLLHHADSYPESQGMGTTLALLINWSKDWYSVHIGDSRVYHFAKDGQIKWRSKDHSQVQELVDAEVISEEEARTHPQRNIITRALKAKKDYQVTADWTKIENVEQGDYFLLCSDGLTESWLDTGLSAVLAQDQLLQDSMDELSNYAIENSSDNNTAILLRLVDSPTVLDDKGSINESPTYS